jgi:hypothetical protein
MKLMEMAIGFGIIRIRGIMGKSRVMEKYRPK